VLSLLYSREKAKSHLGNVGKKKAHVRELEWKVRNGRKA
jgi:hypothetical protein